MDSRSTPYAFDKKTQNFAQGLDFLRFWSRFETLDIPGWLYISTEKMRSGLRAPKTWENDCLPRTAFPLGFGPLFGLISCPDRFPARARATFRPDPLPRPTALAPRQAKTVNLGPDPLPRPTTLAPRQAKTANLGPDPLPRPPT